LEHLISFRIDATRARGEFTAFIQREKFRACIILTLRKRTVSGEDNIGDLNIEEISI
jgi:hypothetical protein